MSGVDIDHLLLVACFLAVVWLTGRLFRVIRLPGILGELLAGILLGPKCFDLVPYASAGTCERIYERRLSAAAADPNATSGSGSGDDCMFVHTWQGEHTVDIWSFAGSLGVTLLIMESGMHINFAKVAQVGCRALAVAVIGTAFPLLCGMALTQLFFPGRLYPDGFAAGCSLAPTSVGISIKLLEESKMLNSIAGQTTLTAAVVDDVFSLVLLVLLNNLAGGNADAGLIALRTVLAFLFLGVAVLLAKFVFPRITSLLERIPPAKGASIQPRDEAHLFLMLATLAVSCYVASAIGSHLLGAFATGMCFTKVARSHAIWVTQFKRITKWLIRIFFAASVGFAVPLQVMMTRDAVLRGIAFGAVPGVLCKVASGVAARMAYHSAEEGKAAAAASWATLNGHVQPIQYLVGCAMVARAEFAFLVAGEANALAYAGGSRGATMLSDEVYAAVLWALLWALFLAPFLFGWALNVYTTSNPVHRSSEIGGSPRGGEDFAIRVIGDHHTGMLHEVIDTLHAEGLDIIEAHIEVLKGDKASDEHTDSDVFIVRSRGKQKDFDSEKLHDIRHHLTELFSSSEASNSRILFETVDPDRSTKNSAREMGGIIKPPREGVEQKIRAASSKLLAASALTQSAVAGGAHPHPVSV